MSGTSAGDPLPLEDLRPGTSVPEHRREALAGKTLEPGVQCPQNQSRCVSRFPSMRCCRLRVGRSQVFSRKTGSAQESPRVRLTRLQNEAAVTKVSAIKIGRMRPLPEVYSIPIPEQVCPQRNAVVRLLKLTTETGPASNWRRPVILRLRCVSLWLQQNRTTHEFHNACRVVDEAPSSAFLSSHARPLPIQASRPT